MKSATILTGSVTIILAIALTPAPGNAQEQGVVLTPAPVKAPEHGIYFNADFGLALAEDAEFKQAPDALSGDDIEFEPGFRMNVGGGYRFTEWFSAGGEMGFVMNGIDDVDAYVTQAPFLANVEFRIPNRSAIVPFFGGGPGVSFTGISVYDDEINGSNLDGSASDAVFAWQVYGGARVRLQDNMWLGAAYKYLEVDSPSWDVSHTSQDIRFGRMRSHSFTASLTMSF
jgi:opacity protein-like surface antigen